MGLRGTSYDFSIVYRTIRTAHLLGKIQQISTTHGGQKVESWDEVAEDVPDRDLQLFFMH